MPGPGRNKSDNYRYYIMVRFTTLFITVNPNRVDDAAAQFLKEATYEIWTQELDQWTGLEGAQGTITAFGLERGDHFHRIHCHYSVVVETKHGGFKLSGLNRTLQNMYQEKIGFPVYVKAKLTTTGRALNYSSKQSVAPTPGPGAVLASRTLQFRVPNTRGIPLRQPRPF
jgi:hypothetical protein